MLGYFEDSEDNKNTHRLIRAVFNELVQESKIIIDESPEQLNTQDPFAGLTPLHIAIFKQNISLIRMIANHQTTNFKLKDNFGRIAADMLEYTADQEIFELVMDRTYPDLMNALESEEYEAGLSSGSIKPFKPK